MNSAPIFIGGAGRSGTTLLRAILDSHSRIACGPELKIGAMLLRQWREIKALEVALHDGQTVSPLECDRLYRELFLGFLEPYWRASGKPRIAEKTPNNVFNFDALLELIPGAVAVHIIRDGRDVVASLLRSDWRDLETGERPAAARDAYHAALYWLLAVATGRKIGRRLPQRYCEIRYEELVRHPESVLKGLFRFLGESWEPGVLDFHRTWKGADPNRGEVMWPIHRASVGKWRFALTEGEQKTVNEVAGALISALGYEAPLIPFSQPEALAIS